MKTLYLSLITFLALNMLAPAALTYGAVEIEILPKTGNNGSLPRSFIGYGLLKATPEKSKVENGVKVLRVKQGTSILKIIESHENRIFRIVHRVQVDPSKKVDDLFSEAKSKFGRPKLEKKDRLEFSDGRTTLIVRHRERNEGATISVELHDIALLKEVAVKIAK